MSKLSIYQTKWTDLVFEDKNKEYGAYQLRQENSKTTVTALFMGLLLLAAIGSVSVLASKFQNNPAPIDTTNPYDGTVITPVDIDPLVIPKTDPITPPAQEQAAAAPVTDASQLVDPIIVPSSQATPEIATNANNTPTVVSPSDGTGTLVNAIPTSGGNGPGIDTAVPSGPEKPVSTAILDKLPEFPGGIANFYTYVSRNFKTPELDAERTFRVYVSFVVEKDGSLTNIMVKNDPGYGMGKEAVRVLKSLKTKWAPGILDGNAVRTAYNLPITIKTQPE
ncbi:energy transducer TonB [Flavobacterium reichenbachii]|uniref:Energy transducer TonB n=1 Tax=Flavobacterium reichenbachii TaxID=362418 RepID=A0A085ZL09_9FLAO|nr:energy transducer TonB [Flavobacterium reichenbachii]KFF05123.1 energy transducer TonB [Flavobacterium reichenbachii]OXB16207.1 energy transducer TonB [Flavobacterium reichenbachii]